MSTDPKPWEGPDGHLFCRDLCIYLLATGGNAELVYALEKPWKYARDVEAYRAALAKDDNTYRAAWAAFDALTKGRS